MFDYVFNNVYDDDDADSEDDDEDDKMMMMMMMKMMTMFDLVFSYISTMLLHRF
jgi:hypothetical protein